MNYVSVIEDKLYLLWQQEIQLLNLKEKGIRGTVVILYKGAISSYAKSLSQYGDVYYYENDSPFQSYLPSNKAWGMYKLLSEAPHLGTNLILIDSDVLLVKEPVLNVRTNYGADCDSYLGYKYMSQHLNDAHIEEALSGIISLEKMKKLKGVGAQYFFKSITAKQCATVASDSVRIYERLVGFQKRYGSKIQVWTAEMWSWLWNFAAEEGIECSEELNFTWATSPIAEYPTKNFLHIAGVTSKEMGMFYKGLYTITKPWENKDFTYITNRNTCAWMYFQEIIRLKGLGIEDYNYGPIQK